MSYLALPRIGWRAKQRLPLIAQTELVECGLACIAMVAHYYGREESLHELRQRFPLSLKGVTMLRLAEVARALKLQSRPLQLELHELKDLRTPCILHWNFNHFVVLKRANARRIVIHDPSDGKRTLSLKAASNHFTGVALELWPEAKFTSIKSQTRFSLRSLVLSLPGINLAIARILGLALILEVAALISPLFVQVILDEVVSKSDKQLLVVAGTGFMALLVVQTALAAARSWTVALLGARLNIGWGTGVLAHLLSLPDEYFQRRGLSDIVSRVGAVANIQRTITTRFVEVVLDGLMAAFALAMLTSYSVKLAAITGTSFALYAALRAGWFAPLREANLAMILAVVKGQSLLFESVRGARSIRLHNAIVAQTSRYASAMAEVWVSNLDVQRLGLQFSSLNMLIFGVQNIATLWLGALLVMNGQLSVGMLLAFAAFSSQFTSRATALIDYFFELRMLRTDAERLSDIVLNSPEKHVRSETDTVISSTCIELCDIGFRYSPHDPWVLRHFNLTIEPGESVALVGPSGCGKTTLAKILLGLLDPEEGHVLIGGVDLCVLGKEKLRAISAAVLEDDALLVGSVAQNIAFFDSNMQTASVVRAAQLAAIHDEIAAMPMGYESLVGDMGTTLSAGQLQRLLLARAIYKQPKILVLDEATSRLDPVNEAKVVASIRAQTITRISIAHRPDTVASASRCIAIHNGQAIEHTKSTT